MAMQGYHWRAAGLSRRVKAKRQFETAPAPRMLTLGKRKHKKQKHGMSSDSLPPPPARVVSRARLWLPLLLALLVVGLYAGAAKNDFVNIDDDLFVTDNYHVLSGLTWEGVRWAFTSVKTSHYWQPLTWLSHMVDGELYGTDPAGHHMSNVLLHAANVLLLFFALHRLTGAFWRSLLVTACFALHPLNSEPVLWASERKGLLSSTFWFLTLWAYAGYARGQLSVNSDQSTGGRSALITGHRSLITIRGYALTLLFFTVGLMAKTMLVTMPFLLLVLDYWPLRRVEGGAWSADKARRWRGLFLEKVPMIVLAVAATVANIYTESEAGTIPTLDRLSVAARFSNVVTSYLRYLGRLVWPAKLTVFFPHPGDIAPFWPTILSVAVLVGVTVAVFRARRHPYLPAGWLWFLGTLLPVIGIVQAGRLSIADRYAYVTFIGLFIMIAWGVADALAVAEARQGGKRLVPLRNAVVAGAVLILALWARHAWRQIPNWRDSISLFRHNLAVIGENGVAHDGIARQLFEEGNYEEAETHFRKSIRDIPGYTASYVRLGRAIAEQGRVDEAIEYLDEALQIDSEHYLAHNTLGTLYLRKGRVEDAVAEFHASLAKKKDFAEAHSNLGIALVLQGKKDESLESFRQAVRFGPYNAEAYNNLGRVLTMVGRAAEALPYLSRAVEIKSSYLDAWDNLAQVYAALGRRAEAERCGLTALNLAVSSGQNERTQVLQERLESYRTGSP